MNWVWTWGEISFGYLDGEDFGLMTANTSESFGIKKSMVENGTLPWRTNELQSANYKSRQKRDGGVLSSRHMPGGRDMKDTQTMLDTPCMRGMRTFHLRKVLRTARLAHAWRRTRYVGASRRFRSPLKRNVTPTAIFPTSIKLAKYIKTYIIYLWP